jgi:uncharacterized membrane protein YoaK (UPF0700 family)
MTGMVSSMADYLVLGDWHAATAAFSALVSFLLGAATSAILINYGKRRQLKSLFAMPLLLEAVLLLVFGLVGAQLSNFQGFFVPFTVVLLCYVMGLQNAVITKISNTDIRTTHVTGLVTDLGIEIGKLVYWNRMHSEVAHRVLADRERMLVLSLLIFAFFLGGVIGALGFQHLGYLATAPLSFILAVLAIVPLTDDIRHYLARTGT